MVKKSILDEQSELEFENQVIDYIQHIDSSQQWEYLSNVKTIDGLWDNFKKILERRNYQSLHGKPLSLDEFAQVKAEIEKIDTPYQAGQFLYGMNGVCEVEIDRDNGDHVFLNVFDQSQVGTADTTYQIVNQIEVPAVQAGNHNRRFDTTLLINGLPIIQIEEKKHGHNVREALEQMRQYIREGLFGGIFSTLQILIGMTETEIRYMANTTYKMFNTDFAFEWADEIENKPVTNWKTFVESFLSIPMAHQMATDYMILDGTKNKEMIKIMRSYQVYATKNVIDKVRHHEFGNGSEKKIGYIWHTTGSGKTISSFKAAFLASRLPNVEKVVFLVDRTALTNQTYDEYRAYDPNGDENNNGGVVNDTPNTSDLSKKLRSKPHGIIVTSIQKMARLAKTKKDDKFQKHVLFIVDEAHRSTAGDMLIDIQKAFPNSAWVGYTGTPRFAEDNQQEKHKQPTTKDIFGDPLHIYTIKNAIADKNVLGFKVDFKTTLSEDVLKNDYLPNFLREKHPNWGDDAINERIRNFGPKEMDDSVSTSVYDDNIEHVREVVKDVLANWDNRSVNRKYNAILTTHVGGGKVSTRMAMMYFREFLEQMKHWDEEPLKIGITFSEDKSNSIEQDTKNSDLDYALEVYNKQFGTSFGRNSMKEYNEDLAARLSKTILSEKEDPTQDYLDLMIVVDRLLTGFNAPEMNALYVDRILKGANLIQAYSRTNRVQDMKYKPFGRIVNYRWPAKSEELMNEALTTYANRASANEQTVLETEDEIIAPKFEDVKAKIKKISGQIKNLTDEDFLRIPDDEKKQDEMYRLLRQFENSRAEIEQYDEFKESYQTKEDFYEDIDLTMDQADKISNRLKHQVIDAISERKGIDPIMIDFEMQQVKEVKVNYDYLTELIAKLSNLVNDNADEEKVDEAYNEIVDRLAQMDDQSLVASIRKFIDDIRAKLVNIKEYPVKPEDVDDLMNEHKEANNLDLIKEFAYDYGADLEKLETSINEAEAYYKTGKDEISNSALLAELLKDSAATYKENAQNDEIRKLAKIKYRNQFRYDFLKLINEILK